MKTTDFNTQLTSSKLHENLEKQFGAKVNLEKYDREQLEDIRNKLRTRIFQQEGTAGVNDLLTNETYQKNKAMLELLNTRIKEMLGEQMKKLRDTIDQLNENKKGVKAVKHTTKAKGSKPDFLDMDKDGDKKEPMKKAIKDKEMKEGAKPDYIDLDKDGNKKETMKKAAKDAKVKEAFPVPGETQEKTTGKFDKKKISTGTVYTKKAEKEKDSEKKDKDLEEGKSCSEGHTKMTKGCAGCADMRESKDVSKPGNKQDKLPSMAHIKKMCQDGKSVAEICKMHPNCDQKVLKQMVADCKKKMVKESQFKHNVRFVNESLDFLLQEDEEGKAKAITAAGDMVNDFTSWMQRVGQYQTKSMIELADAIRADFGAAEAETFKNSVGPALLATLEVLTQQREAVSNAVAVLAGEAVPEEPMGMEPDMGIDADMDMSAPDEMNPEAGADLGDEFGASDAGSAGREMRESKQEIRARKLAESHSIISKLAR
jgi:hypothetical protein